MKKRTRLRRPTAVSLFSGCGGLDLGLKESGIDVVLANDADKYCVASFRENFPDVPVYEGSVTDLKPAKMRQVSTRAVEGEVDLVFGGPPCPPFSKSRFYRKEMPRGLNDPVGFETLTGYMDVVKRLRPKVFLLENVPGFAYGVQRQALDFVLERAESLGYATNFGVLDSASYGVPQRRQRFFLVASKFGKVALPAPTHRDPADSDLFASALKPWVTAGDVLNDLDTEEQADDTGHFAGGRHHDLLVEVPPGENYLHFTKERGHPTPQFKWRSRYWSFLLKLSPSLPSWTIQARRSNNMGPFHWRNRILRIEEVKRLQTFPDDWFLSGTVERQWRQLGNAVPPKMAAALGRAIVSHLSTHTEEE